MESAIPATGQHLPTGSLAFLFTDIEGSTVRWERTPDAMEAAIGRHDRVMRQLFIGQGGHVFKTMGDAFCVAFATPSAALTAAVEAQHALRAEDFSAVDGIKARMAIHVGEVQARDADYFGQPVNRVARLLSVAHGEQVILSAAAAAMVRGRLPAALGLIELGEHRLKDLAHPETVFQVTGPGLRAEFPPLRSLSILKHNLPVQPTSFVGRETEQAELTGHMSRHRLVTLLGAGGLGKTRLSLQIAAELVTQFPDGVWFVELAPLGSPELLAETMASVFGLTVSVGADATAAVTTFLRQKSLLLVFDNCEHLLAEVARVAAAVLRAAPDVRILASSRERLGVAGEFVYPVPPLGLPAKGTTIGAAEAMNHAGVRLFVERAALVLGGFELTDENAADVVEICRRLDGIALAIELAVPRLRMLRPAELLARLKDRFRLLTGGDRSALPRQQTLRALIDWSFNLLSDAERLTLCRLAVFADSASLDGAAKVMSDERLDEWEIFDVMTALQDKSLIVRTEGEHAESRFGMYESTRAYALEKLRESGEEAVFRGRLASYLTQLFTTAEREYPTAATGPWLASHAPELENLRSAMDWCFSAVGDQRTGAELVGLALYLFDELSLPRERARWLELAANAIDDDTPSLIAGRILFGQANFASFGERRHTETLLKAINLFRAAGSPIWLARALSALGIVRAAPGDVAEAEAYYREAEAILRPLGRTRVLCQLLSVMGTAREFAGDPAGARALYEASIEMARSLGSRPTLLNAISNLAEFEFADGCVERALALAREAESAARQSKSLVRLAAQCSNLAGYLIAGGDIAASRAHGVEGLALNIALGQENYAVVCLEHLALAHALSGDTLRAARIAGYGERYYAMAGRAREATEQATWDRLTAVLAETFPADALARAKAVGAAWNLGEAAAAAVEPSLAP